MSQQWLSTVSLSHRFIHKSRQIRFKLLKGVDIKIVFFKLVAPIEERKCKASHIILHSSGHIRLAPALCRNIYSGKFKMKQNM